MGNKYWNVRLIVLLQLGLVFGLGLSGEAWPCNFGSMWGRRADGERMGKGISRITWLGKSFSRCRGRPGQRGKSLACVMKYHPRIWDINSFVERNGSSNYLDSGLGYDNSNGNSTRALVSMDQFSPLERMILTACGTVQHIIR